MIALPLDFYKAKQLAERFQSFGKYSNDRPPEWLTEGEVRLLANVVLHFLSGQERQQSPVDQSRFNKN